MNEYHCGSVWAIGLTVLTLAMTSCTEKLELARIERVPIKCEVSNK